MRRGLGHPDRPATARGLFAEKESTLTVTELTRQVKALLEGKIGTVAVEGEISGLKASPSGHVYFSLKDSLALVDCVIWRSAASRMRDLPPDGTKVTAKGKLAVYEPRGRYQLVVTSLSGDDSKGDLWRRFEELKEKLAAEGIFSPDRKRQLPVNPRTIGIVTSPTGAVLRDMLKILSRRAPNIRVVVSPCPVQGREAAGEIVAALRRIDEWGEADVVVVGRGGGSLEDLWPFNEETVARAIAVMKTPVVSAIGHETDFTIADFVADVRASTPSEAAERIAPDHSHLRGRIDHAAFAITRAMSGMIREYRHRLDGLARSPVFRRPLDMFMTRWQQLDGAMAGLADGMQAGLDDAGSRVRLAGAKLAGLSPYGVLSRGYAVVLGPDGKPAINAADVAAGDRITAILHQGRLKAVVEDNSL